jgi:inhibitor of cysteine peptidase
VARTSGLGDTVVTLRRRAIRLWVVLVLFPFLLSGCRSNQGPAEFLFREAEVESVEVSLTDARPVGASAVIRGTVPEACTKLDEIRQEYIDSTSTFVLILTTRRPVEEPCLQVVTPFEATVPLAIERLPNGIYTVVANGVTTTFRLEADVPVPIQ